MKLRVKCPPGESACTVTLRIRKDGRQIVSRRIVTIKPGATKTVTLPADPQRSRPVGPLSLIDRRRDRVDPLGDGLPRYDQKHDQAAGATALGGSHAPIKEDEVPRGVSTAACAAALAALAVATPSAFAAPGTVTDTDFTGGTSASTEVIAPGSLRLARTPITEEFAWHDAARGLTATTPWPTMGPARWPPTR